MLDGGSMHTSAFLFILATAVAGSPPETTWLKVTPAYDAKSCRDTVAQIKKKRGFPDDNSEAARQLNISKKTSLKIEGLRFPFVGESLEQNAATEFSDYAKEYSDPAKERRFKEIARTYATACTERKRETQQAGNKFDFDKCFTDFFKIDGISDEEITLFDPSKAFLTSEEKEEYKKSSDEDVKKALSKKSVQRALCIGTENKPYRKLIESWVSSNQIAVRTEGCAYNGHTDDHYIDVPSCEISRFRGEVQPPPTSGVFLPKPKDESYISVPKVEDSSAGEEGAEPAARVR